MTTKKKAAAPAKAPKVEKRKVTMRSVVLAGDGTTVEHEATDFVPLDILEDYVADAQTRWQLVEVDRSKHDPGPAGDDGPTFRPPKMKK